MAMPLSSYVDPDIKIAHKLASTWVAGFWGIVSMAIMISPIFVNMGNIWWLGPILLLASASFAIARFTNQPGAA